MFCTDQRKWSSGLWFLMKSCLVTLLRDDWPKTDQSETKISSSSCPVVRKKQRISTLPDELPSLVEIRRSLPKYCFEPSVARSLYYVVLNVVGVGLLYGGLVYLEWLLPSYIVYTISPLYWFFQGTLLAGIFVLGHDCGHGSFSKYTLLNDIVGNVLHAFLMVPYYCWKLSHKNHHKNTGNIDKDEVFYPVRKKNDSGGRMLPGFGLGFGWYAYIVRGYSPRQVCHLNIFHKMYANHSLDCAISIFLVTVWGVALAFYAQAMGLWALISHYVIPALIFGTWVVIFTFLHHTEEDVPWYSDAKWDFVRGQLSSVDRDYGWAHYFIHTIGTHQIHHLFSKIPHYHLDEATAHFRKAFPHLVRYDDSPILPSFIRMFKKYLRQSVISDEADIHIYH